MSWFCGAIGNLSAKDRYYFEELAANDHLVVHRSEHLLLLAGGIPKTCTTQINDDGSGFVVVGKCISQSPLHFITADEWDDLTSKSQDAIPSLNGHFAAVNWTSDSCSFYTDRLGLRDITLYESHGVLYFTTNEAYLPTLTGTSHEVNWQAFSGRWTLSNQFSLDSIVKNTVRLTSGTGANFINGNLQISIAPPLDLSLGNTDGENASELLRSFIELPHAEHEKLFVALSAGMDSRLLLSYLLSSQQKLQYSTYTFEDENHPDALIMAEMVYDLKFPNTIIGAELPADDAVLVKQLRKYLVAKKVTTNSVHFLDSLPYDRFKTSNGGVLIDGGFGEIGRRRLYEKLRVRHKKEILTNDPRNIHPLFSRDRADIFSDELTNSLLAFAEEQVAQYMSASPDPASIGIDQWLDLISVRTALPNYNGFEQARVDGIITNICPFTQPEFITQIMACPIELRRNARLYRSLIERNAPQLKKYPLVKFNATYPYRFSSAGAFLWTSAKRKIGQTFLSENRINLLQRLEAFIRDTAESRSVKEYAPYDQEKVRSIIENFYSGKHWFAPQLDWWLSFEVWRQSLTFNA